MRKHRIHRGTRKLNIKLGPLPNKWCVCVCVQHAPYPACTKQKLRNYKNKKLVIWRIEQNIIIIKEIKEKKEKNETYPLTPKYTIVIGPMRTAQRKYAQVLGRVRCTRCGPWTQTGYTILHTVANATSG